MRHLKNTPLSALSSFLAPLLVVSLLCSCQTVSRVTVKTQPPGGKIVIAELDKEAFDGAVMELPAGSYLLTAQKEGHDDGQLVLEVDGRIDQVVTVPLGAGFAPLTLRTDPPGLEATIVESARRLSDGDTISLPRGSYTFILHPVGYRKTTVLVEMDGTTPQTLRLSRGEGFAFVNIRSEPASAELTLNREPPEVGPLALELSAGHHRVEARLEGFHPEVQEFEVVPGQPVELTLTLSKIPISGPVNLSTQPPGGRISFRDREVGTGKASLSSVPFGDYTASAVKELDQFNRLSGRISFKHQDASGTSATIALDKREYLYEGSWMPTAEAHQREEERYRQQRVSSPLAVDLTLSSTAMEELVMDPHLTEGLQAILRVGDRVVVQAPEREHRIWKRHRTITPEFLLEVSALGTVDEADINAVEPFSWPDDPVSGRIALAVDEGEALSALAFALHRGRASVPLLDLKAEQLSDDGETVYRDAADGSITLVAVGAKELSVDEQPVPVVSDELLVHEIAAGDGPLKITWAQAPARVLVISDRESGLPSLPEDLTLKLHQKELVSLAPGKEVEHLVRLSRDPESGFWERTEIRAEGPLADQIDLSRDEAGPHDHAGNYHRIWLVRIIDKNSMSQRQLEVNYQVLDETRDSQSDRFLRR